MQGTYCVYNKSFSMKQWVGLFGMSRIMLNNPMSLESFCIPE